MPHRNRAAQSAGFTLVELLVVIFIIALLASILIPTVKKVRTSGYVTSTKAFISQLDGAIQRYYNEFHAYPGPVPNNQCGYNPTNIADTIYSVQTGKDLNRNMTGAENLALGLLGGLSRNTNNTPADPTDDKINFDIQQMLSAKGPGTLGTGLPKVYPAFMDAKQLFSGADPTDASKTNGFYRDEAGWALNTEIPEFLDSFPSAMPILYLRANVGAPVPPTPYTADANPIITQDRTSFPATPAQYDLKQIIGYTDGNKILNKGYIGEGKTLPQYKGGTNNSAPAHGLRTVTVTASLDKNSSNYVYPYDAYAYFSNPNIPNTARQKDSYILISAGPDRVYGTSDDICNFGDVAP